MLFPNIFLLIYANQELKCPFEQVPRFRNAAGNATLACGYENLAHSRHLNP
ncbi:MAG: hypothetical protein LBG92_07265 [Prevotellaceae bacterium]|nr:hypothetical protein [Prevotellaceae bacterium]